MATRFVGMKQLRQNMAKIARQAQQRNERVIVLRKNKPVFELRPLSDEDALIESFARDIAKAREQVERGEVYSQEEVLKELGL